MKNNFTKTCPKCGKEQKYSTPQNYYKALKQNRQCRECMFNSLDYKIKHMENTKNMWSDENKKFLILQNRNSEESKLKWKKSISPTLNSVDYKKKQSKIQKKIMTEEKILNISNKLKNLWKDKSSVFYRESFRKRLSDTVKKNWQDVEVRKKMLSGCKWKHTKVDKGQLELLEKWNKLGFNFEPNYQIKTDLDLFYVDGYDKEKNVVLEYDSKYHQRKTQKEKDLVRQQKIINALKPKVFWRFDSVNKTFNNVIGRNLR